jgi:hypothetical protein
VDDEVLARLAALVGVVDAGVYERFLDPVAIDGDRGLVRVLLDDGEEVAEEPALLGRELGPLDRRDRRGALDAVDGRARDDPRTSAGAVSAAGSVPTADAVPAAGAVSGVRGPRAVAVAVRAVVDPRLTLLAAPDLRG